MIAEQNGPYTPGMSDNLFENMPGAGSGETYDGSAIEVLEGLEPVPRRPRI
ncbi:MAG: hypothetical protein VX309_10200 [Pseudomonadota bacterium]|nr:hypothetical protein [Pseudomonadota bacterium]